MEDFSLNLNIRKLKSHVMKLKGKSGMIDCVVLPIEANHMVTGNDGSYDALYLNFNGHAIKNPAPNSKNTHLVKQNLPKDIYTLLSEEDRKNLPIVGNAIVWGSSRTSAPEDYPVEVPESNSGQENYTEDSNDLPF